MLVHYYWMLIARWLITLQLASGDDNNGAREREGGASTN